MKASNAFEDLNGKVAAITGGGGEIGTAFALALAKQGVKTAILDLDPNKGQALANRVQSETEAESIAIACDVLSSDSLKAADQEIADRLGPIDCLINGAGGNNPKASSNDEQLKADLSNLENSFFGIDIDGFRQCLDLNLLGTVLPTSILGKRLLNRPGATIVNISSMNAYRPLTKIPAYSAAKCAVSNFTEWLAVHLAPTGVRVNAIAPGFFLTEQLKFLAFDENGELTPRYQRVLAQTPMGRLGEPEELGGTLLYLISDISRFVTGVIIPVDGGFNVYSGV